MIKYYPTKVHLWLVIEDGSEIPVQSMSVKYAINHIPIARIEFAVGRFVNNTQVRSAIHDVAKQLKEGLRVKVMCALNGFAGKVNNTKVIWPGERKPFCVFEGTVLSSSPERGAGLRIAVGAAHWLETLERTSWTNSIITTGSPAGSIQSALYTLSPDQLSGVVPFIDGAGLGSQFRLGEYTEDVWKKCLKPVLLKATTNDLSLVALQQQEDTFLRLLFGDSPPNRAGEEALNRMDDERYIGYKPLRLFSIGADGRLPVSNNVINSFVQNLGRVMWTEQNAPSLWQKIVMFSQVTMFPIIPLVETASLVPWVPVSNKTWMTLTDEDIWTLSANVVVPKKYRGVVLFGNTPTIQSALTSDRVPGVVGFYDIGQDNSGIRKENIGENPGTMLSMFSPEWLNFGNVSYNPRDIGKTIKYTYAGAGNPRRINPNYETRNEENAKSQVDIGNKFAKAIYMTEAFNGKTLNFTSRLRFDIAPGSHIRLKGENDGFDLPGYTEDGVYVTVNSVTINISAAQSSCSTQFETTHVRLEHEKDFYLDEHPISGNLWYGGPLTHVDGVTPDLV